MQKQSKTLKLLTYSIFVFVFGACRTETLKKSGNFELLPAPQKLEITGISNLKVDDLKKAFSENNESLPILGDVIRIVEKTQTSSKAQIIYGIDDELAVSSEGYTLKITGDQITLTGKDQAGLFYAFKTLEQLATDAVEQDVYLPECSVVDFPSLAFRSIHLDIKHHREKIDYYYRLMDKLSGYKINAIIVEVEDKLKFKRQPKVASGDALSIEEWKRLSTYAKARNIEISPLMQGLGHSSFVLKHDEYKHLRDNPESDWAYNPLNHETYEVQFDLYLDVMEAMPHGRYLHIGGDEVHTTGSGSGRSPLELQLLWLDKVSKFATENGRIPIFWDDMPLKHAKVYRAMFDTSLTEQQVDSIWSKNEYKLAAFLDQFPKQCIYMRWNYQAPEALGNTKAMEWFIKNGMQAMGATSGQTRWVLMPQNESNIPNIRTFALSSIDMGLQGLLLTLWDDDSPHFELYMRGILAFAEYSWAGDQRTKEEVKAVYRHREYGSSIADEQYAFIDRLEKPVALWKNILLEGNSRNHLTRNSKAIDQSVISMPETGKPGDWSKIYSDRIADAKETLKTLEDIQTRIDAAKKQAKRGVFNLEVYEQVTQLVKFSNQALLKLHEFDQTLDEGKRQEINLELAILKDQFHLVRSDLEEIYGKTRVLTKSEDYLLDQDHHVHLANQSLSFDWQFYAELLFLEKLERDVINGAD